MIESEQGASELPRGWAFLTLNDIASGEDNAIKRGPFGSAVKKEFFVPSGYKVYEQQNVIHNDFGLGSYYIDEAKFKELEDFELKPGDIVISCSGTIGRIAIAPQNSHKGIINQALLKITLNDEIVFSKYFVYLFSSDLSQKKVLKSTRGTAMKNIESVKALKQIPFPIPPINEQKRIIGKVEELFSLLDAGVESLRKVQAQLKRYRQAVLKYAFEGKLTEDWLKTHKDQIETAQKLLEHAKPECKPEIAPLASLVLPSNWVWAQFDAVCNKIQDGTHFSPKTQYAKPGKDTYLYITSKNIKESGIDLSNVTYIDFLQHKTICARCNPEKNDVLLIKDGVKTGIATVNNLVEPFSLLSSVALFKPKKDVLNPYYLKHFLNSPVGFKLTTGKMTGTAIKRIILDKIRKSCLPLAPFAEQVKIVEEVEFRLSIADEVALIIEKNLNQTVIFRNSVLHRAFQGMLVPQDPDDEPAEKLLERIKIERVKRKPECAPSGNSKKSNTDEQVELSRYVK